MRGLVLDKMFIISGLNKSYSDFLRGGPALRLETRSASFRVNWVQYFWRIPRSLSPGSRAKVRVTKYAWKVTEKNETKWLVGIWIKRTILITVGARNPNSEIWTPFQIQTFQSSVLEWLKPSKIWTKKSSDLGWCSDFWVRISSPHCNTLCCLNIKDAQLRY